MDDMEHVDGYVDLVILNKIQIVLQDSQETEDQQLGEWIKTNYLRMALHPGYSLSPINTRQGFRNLDRAYKRVRMLTGRAQDEWPFYYQKFKNNPNAFRKYALGEDKALDQGFHAVETATQKSAAVSKTPPTESQSSAINVTQFATLQTENAGDSMLSPEGMEVDSALSSSRVMSESLDNSAESIAAFSASNDSPTTAALAEPISTNLDKLPPGSNRISHKRKHQVQGSPASKSASTHRPAKLQKLDSTPNSSNKDSPTNTEAGSKSKGAQKVNTPKTRVTRRSLRGSLLKNEDGEKVATPHSNNDIEPRGAVQNDQTTDNGTPIDSNLQEGTESQQAGCEAETKDSDPAIVHDTNPNADGENAPVLSPKQGSFEKDRESTSCTESQTVEHILDLTAPRTHSDTTFTEDSAVSGLGTNSQRSSSPHAASATAFPVDASIPQNAVGKQAVREIEFFARVSTDKGPFEVKLSQNSMKDLETLTTQIRKYVEFSQTEGASSNISFEQFLMIFAFARKQA
ncbi:unnamed protein product [Periconia digitata]|uniref:Uncharacterized protein n=1 Tax=Periconia digitata TaxID=1303443 RepID=A0A9W4U8P5_9PLEO|nr:unnamed protein product [Periconia digitata]